MEPQHRAAQGGLAAAGFAHDAQGFSFVNRQTDSVHGVELLLLAYVEIFGEILHLDEWTAHVHTS